MAYLSLLVYLVRSVYGLWVHSVYVLTHHFCSWTDLSLAKHTVLFSMWFSLEITCSIPFSEVLPVPVVCLFCVSISKKPSACPVFSVLSVFHSWRDGWICGLAKVAVSSEIDFSYSRNLRSFLEQAHSLKLYLEGHQCFLQRLYFLFVQLLKTSQQQNLIDYVCHKIILHSLIYFLCTIRIGKEQQRQAHMADQFDRLPG